MYSCRVDIVSEFVNVSSGDGILAMYGIQVARLTSEPESNVVPLTSEDTGLSNSSGEFPLARNRAVRLRRATQTPTDKARISLATPMEVPRIFAVENLLSSAS
jgi:hypothetical protein